MVTAVVFSLVPDSRIGAKVCHTRQRVADPARHSLEPASYKPQFYRKHPRQCGFSPAKAYIGGLKAQGAPQFLAVREDRKSTRLNSSHQIISYAVFCLKKKKTDRDLTARNIDAD